MRLQEAYGYRVEFEGGNIRLPPDSLVVGQVPPLNREQEAEKAIPLPVKERDRALQTRELLQRDGPNANWEHWFRLFETELSGRHIPRENWPEIPVNQSSLGVRQEVMSVMQAIRFADVPANMVYEAVRDRLLWNAGMKYHALTYYRRLHSLVPGSRRERDLAAYLKDLAIDSEAATVLMAPELRRLPEISEYTLTQLYWMSLPGNLRDSAPTVEAFRLVGASTLYSSYTSAVVDREATPKVREEARPLTVAAIPVVKDARRKRRLPDDGRAPNCRGREGNPRVNRMRTASKRRDSTADYGRQGERPAVPNHRQQKAEIHCYFCNSPELALTLCQWCDDWKEEDPKRKRLCPKCQRALHHARFWRALKGIRWGPPYGPTRRFPVSAISPRHDAVRENVGSLLRGMFRLAEGPTAPNATEHGPDPRSRAFLQGAQRGGS